MPCIVSPRCKGICTPGHVFLSNPESGKFLFWNLELSWLGSVIFAIPIQSLSQPRPQGFFLKKNGWGGVRFKGKALGTRLVTFYLCIYRTDWMKNTLFFTHNTNILVCLLNVNMKNWLTPKTTKVRPHYNQSSRENATPSSRIPL